MVTKQFFTNALSGRRFCVERSCGTHSCANCDLENLEIEEECAANYKVHLILYPLHLTHFHNTKPAVSRARLSAAYTWNLLKSNMMSKLSKS